MTLFTTLFRDAPSTKHIKELLSLPASVVLHSGRCCLYKQYLSCREISFFLCGVFQEESGCLTLHDRISGCPETSVDNYETRPCNTPEERRLQMFLKIALTLSRSVSSELNILRNRKESGELINLLHIRLPGESNGKLPLRICLGCSVPEPYQSPD
jgi:hypothetical protein